MPGLKSLPLRRRRSLGGSRSETASSRRSGWSRTQSRSATSNSGPSISTWHSKWVRGRERGTYGASPGDDSHIEPYLYLAAWEKVDRSEPFWNDTAFNGASLSYRQLLKTDDPRSAALKFFQRGYSVLTGQPR